MLVKDEKTLSHLGDLKETFQTLRKYNTKLNQANYTFRVSSRNFFDSLSHKEGSRPIQTIQSYHQHEAPRTIKEIQILTGRVSTLNKFVSKATDKCLPFFRVLKKEHSSGLLSVMRSL